MSTLERFVDWITGNSTPTEVSEPSVTENAGMNQPRHGESGQYLPHGSGTGKGDVHRAALEGSQHDTGHEQAPEEDADDDKDTDEKGEIGQGDRDAEVEDLEEVKTEGYNPTGVGKGRESTITNANPEGHNQYSGGGGGGANRPKKIENDEHLELVNKIIDREETLGKTGWKKLPPELAAHDKKIKNAPDGTPVVGWNADKEEFRYGTLQTGMHSPNPDKYAKKPTKGFVQWEGEKQLSSAPVNTMRIELVSDAFGKGKTENSTVNANPEGVNQYSSGAGGRLKGTGKPGKNRFVPGEGVAVKSDAVLKKGGQEVPHPRAGHAGVVVQHDEKGGRTVVELHGSGIQIGVKPDHLEHDEVDRSTPTKAEAPHDPLAGGHKEGEGIQGLAMTGQGGGKTLPYGARVGFHSGEHAGKTVKLGNVIPMRYNKSQVTYRGQKEGLSGGRGEVTVTAEHLSKHAHLVDNLSQVAAVYNREWPQSKRDNLDEEDFAGPDQSFPITKQADVDSASKLIGHADDPEEVKSKIIGIAKRKGLSIPEAWKSKNDTTENANPEGINQYSGVGSSEGKSVHPVAKEHLDKIMSSPHPPSNANQVQSRGQDEYFNSSKLSKAFKSHKEAGNAIRHAYETSKSTTENCDGDTKLHNSDNQDPNMSDSYDNIQHEASKNATAATVRSESPKARDHALTALDHSGSDNSGDAADSHVRAARVHENMATKFRKDGQQAGAEEQDRCAALHRKAASMHSANVVDNVSSKNVKESKTKTISSNRTNNQRGKTMNREAILNALTVNCKCEDDRIALNGLSDETLVMVYNAKAEGSNADVVGGTGSKQVGGKGTVDEYNENADEEYVNGDDEEEEGEGGDEEEDVSMGKKGRMTENQYLAMAPPRLQRVLKNALEVESRERNHLVKRLIANESNPNRRNTLISWLKGKDLEELRNIASLTPAVRNTRREPVREPTLYMGAAGGPGNTFVDNNSDDILPLPVLNFSKEGA